MPRTLKEFRALHKVVDEIYAEAYRLDWPYEELARRAKLAYSTVYRLGTYETVYPRAATVFALAKAVGFEVVLEKRFTKLKLKSA